MASKQFTIDEWFYHYLLDPQKFTITASFFVRIFEICDRICIRENTPLASKFFELDKELSAKSPAGRQAAKLFLKNFIPNSKKLEWIMEEIEIPELQSPLPHKDIYLVKLCLATQDKILITSDIKLKIAIEENKSVLGISVYLADDFMSEYLK